MSQCFYCICFVGACDSCCMTTQMVCSVEDSYSSFPSLPLSACDTDLYLRPLLITFDTIIAACLSLGISALDQPRCLEATIRVRMEF